MVNEETASEKTTRPETNEKVHTGIKGLDKLLEGGIPKNFSVMLEGEIGSYRDMLALQFLYSGAVKGESTLYVSFQKKEPQIIKIAEVFSWKFKELIDAGSISVFFSEMFNFQQFVSTLEDSIFNANATRLVFDSASFIHVFSENDFQYRNSLNEVKKVLDKRQCTGLFLSDTLGDVSGEAIMDGVIRLHHEHGEHFITIPSMHSLATSGQRFPIEFTKSGLEVYNIPVV